MTDEQRGQMELLFEKASALPPAERHAFLAGASADAAVVREVESLLEFSRTESGTLAAPVAALAAQLSSDGIRQGKRVGPYRVGREIGRGGMGAVYLASRDDEFRKTVALKVLPIGMHTDSAVRRFRQERQILAGLEHPNIARLLDGGATEEGLPYLAMEYIDGVPITQYAAGRRLSVVQKLRLFRQLCDGVQCAHQMLVIHRDIKPGNILVTAEGIPKLLDFGIAKLMAPDTAAGEALPETRTRTAMMTPDYASPEQVRGEPATVATDVYALGAVLFELLTGERAHRLRSHDPLELAREICDTDVRAPSSTGAGSLRGDLDNIVIKAMQKDPARRYNSAEQFSEDIRRYLDGLPVIARPDTLVYRAGKFARRHWFGLAALAAVILALGGGIVAAQQQARLAEARFAEGRKLAGRLFEIHADLKRIPGSTKPRERLVSSALEYLDRLAPTAGNDPGFVWELAKAYEKTGDAQGSPSEPSLGRTRDAVTSYRKAIGLEEDLLRRGLLDAAQRESLARSYKMLSVLYRQMRDGKNAVAAARRSVALADGLSRHVAASAYGELSSALQVAGDSVAALETFPKALALLGELAAGKPYDSPEMESLAAEYLVAARAAQGAVRFDEALRFGQQGLDIRERRLASQADDPLNQRELLLTYLTVADVLGAADRPSLEDHTKALPYYRKGLALSEKMVAADAHNATARLDLAIAAGKTATQLDSSNPREAIKLYQRALEAAEALAPEGPERASIRSAYYQSVAIPLAILGRVAEAREDFRQAIALLEPLAARGLQDPRTLDDLADAWRLWGDMELTHGRGEEAMAHSRQALLCAEKAVAIAPRGVRPAWHLSLALESLAHEEELAGLPDDAAGLRQRVFKIWSDWDKMQPNTPYIQQQMRRAEAMIR
jgi:tetratricopeptide (TPR) repeat protein/predicted Ser/Thr protein kinase